MPSKSQNKPKFSQFLKSIKNLTIVQIPLSKDNVEIIKSEHNLKNPIQIEIFVPKKFESCKELLCYSLVRKFKGVRYVGQGWFYMEKSKLPYVSKFSKKFFGDFILKAEEFENSDSFRIYFNVGDYKVILK